MLVSFPEYTLNISPENEWYNCRVRLRDLLYAGGWEKNMTEYDAAGYPKTTICTGYYQVELFIILPAIPEMDR